MLIVFLILIFGFFTADRILNEVVGQNIIVKNQMTKFGTAYLIWILFIFYFTSHILILWLLAFLPHLTFSLFITTLKKHRRKKFEERFEEILGVIIMKMKSGKAFRNAFSEAIAESPVTIQRILIDIRDVVVFSQQNNSERISDFVQMIVMEFAKADLAPHTALKRLVHFRDRLKIQSDFRRRSGQIIQQIRTQSIILTGIYFALFFFVIGRFGFKENVRLIFISLSLFGSGILFIFNKGQKIKWKI